MALLGWMKEAGSSLLTTTLHVPWYAFIILKSLNYIGREALGTEVLRRILFMGLHFSHCFELSNIMAQGVGCQISVIFWVII